MSINATKWTFLVVVVLCASLWPPFIPFPLLPLRLESALLGVKDFLFILLGFPRLASLNGRSPELSEPFVTLGFPFFCVHPRIRVYTRDSLSRSTSGVQTSFFPGSHLRASRTPQVVGLPEEFLSHRYATSLHETACASFHLKIRKLGEEFFFRSFHRN